MVNHFSIKIIIVAVMYNCSRTNLWITSSQLSALLLYSRKFSRGLIFPVFMVDRFMNREISMLVHRCNGSIVHIHEN